MKYVKLIIVIFIATIIFDSCKKSKDKNAPVITLIGSSKVYVEKGTTYNDLGATAYDNEDGDITQNIVINNNVNTNNVGIYTVTYDVQDKSGNKAEEVDRTVEVMIF